MAEKLTEEESVVGKIELECSCGVVIGAAQPDLLGLAVSGHVESGECSVAKGVADAAYDKAKEDFKRELLSGAASFRTAL
ncbi:MAG TPA: hypothetical protein VG929_04630 [Actinomycetota bacterium]|nr:hypothetical protein [Actinomycetota bacterium]